MALRAASIGPENETRPSGVKEWTWVEKAESRASGRSGRRDQVGGWSQRRKGVEVEAESQVMTTEGQEYKAERSIPGRAENGTSRQQRWQDTKTGTGTLYGLAPRPL